MKRIIRNLIIVAPFAILLQTFLDGSPYWIKLVLGTVICAAYLYLVDLLNDKIMQTKPPQPNPRIGSPLTYSQFLTLILTFIIGFLIGALLS